MSEEKQYVAGYALRNPVDFTPKEHYAMMDKQAKDHRREMIVINIGRMLIVPAAIVAFFFLMYLFT